MTADTARDQARGPDILTARPGGVAQRWGTSLGWGSSFAAYLIVLVGAMVALTALLVGLGMLVTHVLEHGAIGQWDHHASSWFSLHGDGFWNTASADVTYVADTIEVAAVALIATVVLLIRHWGRRAFLLATSLAIELAGFAATNSIVARPRPHVRHLGGTPSTFSFPSGHTAATIALYGGLAVVVCVATTRSGLRVTAWIVAGLLAVAVGASRVYRGEHYVTDVVAGAVLGVAALWAAVFIIRLASVDRARAAHAPVTGDGTGERPGASAA